ncbi:permeability factor 2 [Salmo salar]|uniref:Permeability factor 2 n=1 Tax=Salmo salar TaxID=8030 RepID=A0A1S3SDX3_SALSA|nr:permeability factor 2 [Salmo salar]|eukprot:XP_014062542.1 PREDICTED: permeability factor 2-like [Salmo salar]
MNTASITIILLTFLSIFSSTEGIKQPLVLRCLCPKVQAGLIPLRDLKSVWHLSPRPHCSKTEVIVTLKSGGQLCLDPKKRLVKILVERSTKRMQESKRSKEVGSVTPAPLHLSTK